MSLPVPIGGDPGRSEGGGGAISPSPPKTTTGSKRDQALIEQVVAEIRRDWNVMLQENSVINRHLYFIYT